jgi:hypothetical protein
VTKANSPVTTGNIVKIQQSGSQKIFIQTAPKVTQYVTTTSQEHELDDLSHLE